MIYTSRLRRMIESYVVSLSTLRSSNPTSMRLCGESSELKFKKEDVDPDSVKVNKAFSENFEIIVSYNRTVDVFLGYM
jgi:hypothetical protein